MAASNANCAKFRVTYRHEWPQESREWPEEDSKCHKISPVKSVAKVAEGGRHHHVREHERRLQKPALGARQAERFLDLRQDTCRV